MFGLVIRWFMWGWVLGCAGGGLGECVYELLDERVNGCMSSWMAG